MHDLATRLMGEIASARAAVAHKNPRFDLSAFALK
jgi:hypothetical protein